MPGNTKKKSAGTINGQLIGELQTMSHIVDVCRSAKFPGVYTGPTLIVYIVFILLL